MSADHRAGIFTGNESISGLIAKMQCRLIIGPASSPARASLGERFLKYVSADHRAGIFTGDNLRGRKYPVLRVSADHRAGIFTGATPVLHADLALQVCRLIIGPASSPAQ